MKPLLTVLLVFFLCAGFARADAESPAPAPTEMRAVLWTDDYAVALERAAAENKHVLLNFTGSDWCVWCHRLRDEVLAKPAFAAYAREQLILVEVDFPRAKSLDENLRKQNASLAEKFGVNGYPTIVLVDATGGELGRTGYMQGGAKTFVRELKRFAAKPRE